MTHVPYKGPAPAMQDVIGGQVECGFLAGPTVLPQVRAGKLVALAVSGAKRSPLLPEVPTVAESGFAGFDATFSLVLFAPRGTPAPVVEQMHAAMKAALAQADVIERLKQSDQEVVAASPADTAARDAFLLAMMGSPDPVQIDGMGGADPLTSKVAVVSKSERDGIDVDYLFLPEGSVDAFVAHAKRLVAERYPDLNGPDYTTIIDQPAFDRLNATLEDARARGATVIDLAPDQRPDGDQRRKEQHDLEVVHGAVAQAGRERVQHPHAVA